jgi:hypothetical protein
MRWDRSHGLGRAGEATDAWAPWSWDPHVGVVRAGVVRENASAQVRMFTGGRGRVLRRSRDRGRLLLPATAWLSAAAAMWARPSRSMRRRTGSSGSFLRLMILLSCACRFGPWSACIDGACSLPPVRAGSTVVDTGPNSRCSRFAC